MNTKIWKIERLTAYPQSQNQTDVVFCIDWRLLGTQDIYSATCYGQINVEYVPETAYTPYQNLTEAQVLSWVHNAMGPERVLTYEANIDAQLESQVNPVIINLPLPW